MLSINTVEYYGSVITHDLDMHLETMIILTAIVLITKGIYYINNIFSRANLNEYTNYIMFSRMVMGERMKKKFIKQHMLTDGL